MDRIKERASMMWNELREEINTDAVIDLGIIMVGVVCVLLPIAIVCAYIAPRAAKWMCDRGL